MAEKNIRRYIWFACLSGAMAWLPVYFLYLNEYVNLSDFVKLQAIYYITVVVLEVPSGYFSDRVGRKPTLVLSQVFMLLSYGLFISGSTFNVFLVAEVLLAAGMAFMSGTNSAFLYDTLKSLDRSSEYGHYEALITRYSLLTGAAAVLAGGLLTICVPSAGYLVSTATAAVALMAALGFSEPGVASTEQVADFRGQIRACLGALGQPLAAWLALFSVSLFILAHVPFEFYQAYLKLADIAGKLPALPAPLYAAILFTITMLISAWPAGRSIHWQQSLGLVRFSMLCAILQIVIIATMAIALHWAIVLVVLFRNLPMTMAHAPVNAALAPLLQSEFRATYLSLQSLFARLSFGIFLAALSAGIDSTTWPGIREIFFISIVTGTILITILAVAARMVAGIADVKSTVK